MRSACYPTVESTILNAGLSPPPISRCLRAIGICKARNPRAREAPVPAFIMGIRGHPPGAMDWRQCLKGALKPAGPATGPVSWP